MPSGVSLLQEILLPSSHYLAGIFIVCSNVIKESSDGAN